MSQYLRKIVYLELKVLKAFNKYTLPAYLKKKHFF